MKNVYSVSQINAYVRRMFAEDWLLRSVLVRGEVSNCKYHASGHIYFTLKDASGTLSCVMFAGRRRGLSFPMQNGDQVIAAGTVDVYQRAGTYQLYASQIIRDGAGALAEQFERLNDSLVRGIRTLDGFGVDVIILGRGGGSLEDLWAFNEERVAEAVFNCATPTISAVGHETDTVITDFVADLRAPTPSAAAELAVYDLRQYEDTVSEYRRRLETAMADRIQRLRSDLRQRERDLGHLSPDARIRDQRMRADRAWEALAQRMDERIERCRQRTGQQETLYYLMRESLQTARRRAASYDRIGHLMDSSLAGKRHRMELLAGSLAHLSPLARLSGGYGFVSGPDGRAIRTVTDLQEGDPFRVQLRDGRIDAAAVEIHPDGA